MSVFSKIRNWFSRTFGGGSSSRSSSRSRASRVSNYGGGGSRSYRDYSSGGYRSDYEDRQEAERRRRQEQAQKRQATTNALSSISKRTDALSSGRSSSVASSATSAGNGYRAAIRKIEQKTVPPDPKVAAKKASQERATAKLKSIEKKMPTVKSDKARIRSGDYEYAPKAKNINTPSAGDRPSMRITPKGFEKEMQNPAFRKSISASRGFVGKGVSFNVGEALLKGDKNDAYDRAMEEVYQKNKAKGYEIGGELAGALIGFGKAAGGAKTLGKVVGTKALGKEGFEKATEKAVAHWAAKASTRRAAEKELAKAVEKGSVKIANNAMREQLINEFARSRASRIVSALGADASLNLSAGVVNDVARASNMYEPGSKEWWKEVGISTGMNLGIGYGATVLPNKRILTGFPGKGKLREETLETIGKVKGAYNKLDDIGKASFKDAGRLRPDAIKPPKIGESIETKIARAAKESVENRAAQTARASVAEAVEQNADDAAKAELPKMRQAMREAFAQGDDAGRRIDMNEALAKNSPFRQADDVARPQNLDEAVERAARETVENAEQPRIEPISEREALENRVNQMADEPPKRFEPGEEPHRYNNVAEDTPITGKDTLGQAMAKSAYERNTGETVEGGMKTSWHDAWEASKEYHASAAAGQRNRLTKASVSQLNMMDSEAERALREKMIADGELRYNVIHTDEILDKVSKQFRDDPDRWVKDMIDINEGGALDFRATPEWQARTHYIMAVVDPTADPASEIAYTEAFKLASMMSSKAGQTNNLRRQFVHLTPMGRRDAIMDELTNILWNSRGFRKNHPDMPSAMYDGRAYIKEFLENDPVIEQKVKALVEAGTAAKNAESGVKFAAEESSAGVIEDVSKMAKTTDELPTEEALDATDRLIVAHADLIQALNEKNPKTVFDVIQEIRYLNMLGNPKTHLRNLFGSGFFGPVRQMSNFIRGGLEDAVLNSSAVKKSAIDADSIVRHGGLSPEAIREAWTKNPTTEAGKKALEAFERVKPELLGTLKHDNQLYKGRATTAPGKVLDAVSDFNSKLLSGEDDFFKARAFRENYIKSYQRYLNRGTPITPKIEKQIEADAMREAQIATFNEYNEFANWLANISRKANDPNATTLGRWGGRGVNAVMPFTKVPANIMKQSLNYSPLGIAKGYAGIGNAIKKGDAEALTKAIDEMSSGLTGTGIFGLGLLFGQSTDAFTTNPGKDDAAAKFKKAQGVQNYSVMVNIGGKRYSVTLDWLVPNSAAFFAGVETANQIKSGDASLLRLMGSAGEIASRIAEPVMETSMLSGLYSMLESTRNGYGGDDKLSAPHIMLRETVQSYLNSLIPTWAGQASRTAYDSDLQISGETDWEYWKNQMKSKAGLGQTNIFGDALGADTTAYGDVKGAKGNTLVGAIKEGDTDALANYGKSALKNFLSPANIQKVDLSELDQQKIQMYEDAVKNGADPEEMAYLFPKKQYKKQFTMGKGDLAVDVKMSNKDLSTYNQAKTTGGEEGARIALESIMFNRYDKDANGKKTILREGYTEEEKKRIIESFKGKSIREVEEWLYQQPEFKNADDAERRKAIDHLWSLSSQGKSVGAKRAGEQAVIEAQGGDVNEYNFRNELSAKKQEALQPYIDSGLITYEDAVDFARYAGKTYYTENDEGGTSQTYYNKKQMMEYLQSKGYTEEQAAALFNSFKNSNAKEYGSSSGRRRRGRRRRGWRHYGHGHSSKKAKVPTPKTIKASQFAQGTALGSTTKSASTTKSSTKVTPPTLKRVEAKIDLPTVKTTTKKR